MATQWKFKAIEKEATKVLYLVSKAKNNSSQALYYLELYKQLDDSLNSIQNKKKIIESEFKFEYNKKHVIDSIQKNDIGSFVLPQIDQEEILREERKAAFSIVSLAKPHWGQNNQSFLNYL